MISYIDADEFFEKLFQKGFCKRFSWKNKIPETAFYSVDFYCEYCNLTSMHKFDIIKDGTKHLIEKQSARMFLARHKLNESDFWN